MTGTNSNDLVRVHIWVSGRVQGVGFRAFVLQAGSLFGLTGWVRNVGYNDVETVAEGQREAVEKFIETVKSGPRSARVDESRVEWESTTGEYKQFGVRY